MAVMESSCSAPASSFHPFPPGFRFHPTDEELILYFLKRKICHLRMIMDVIAETDVYQWDPEDLPALSKLRTGDRQWFFYCPRGRKYPNGSRSNRGTRHGYWKATGKDRTITCNSRSVGVKKTLVFYRGRAPAGSRTDWVMHEYTMDEEELKRCPRVKDYYALYKLYKKSGAGPKNGEQYGAPFVEEDWIDDCDVNGFLNLCDSAKQVNADTSIGANDQEEQIISDDFINPLVEHSVMDSIPKFSCDYTVQKFVCEEEEQSDLDDQSRDASIPNQYSALQPVDQKCNLPASFDLTQSSISQLQPIDAPEVTSADINGQQACVADKFLIEDYLEIDDLLGPEPAALNSPPPVEFFQFDEVDGLGVPDLYHDGALFISDVAPVEPVHLSQSGIDRSSNGMGDLLSNSCVNNMNNEVINSEMQPHSISDDEINCQLWMQNQTYSVSNPSLPNEGTISPPTSGVLHDVNPTNVHVGVAQYQGTKEDDASQSWFSSALWSFVESIPTAPASASENPLVNRAFERMSSFGRLSMNCRTSGNPAATPMKSCRSRRGYIFMSVVGVLCAGLWMLIR